MANLSRKEKTQRMVLGAIFTAIVVVLQWVGSATTFFGPFSTAVALIPIVLGACLCGPFIGGWLGFVFGLVVIFSGGANLFLAFDVLGTFITVLCKGVACGTTAGFVYMWLSRYNKIVATVLASIICPVINTGVFLLGCYLFFMDSAEAIARELEISVSGMTLFWTLAMGNFVVEVVSNAVLSPVLLRVISLVKKD